MRIHPITKEPVDRELVLERQQRTAMQSAKHLKLWLEESGRRWLVFDSLDLVDSLQFPEEVALFMGHVSRYRSHRQGMPSGEFDVVADPLSGEKIKIPLYKSDVLEVDELDRVIRYLIGEVTKRDPKWSLEGPPR